MLIGADIPPLLIDQLYHYNYIYTERMDPNHEKVHRICHRAAYARLLLRLLRQRKRVRQYTAA